MKVEQARREARQLVESSIRYREVDGLIIVDPVPDSQVIELLSKVLDVYWKHGVEPMFIDLKLAFRNVAGEERLRRALRKLIGVKARWRGNRIVPVR